jgi:hypothetical protein
MRQLLVLFVISTAALLAQGPAAKGGPPKNLKVLTPETFRPLMNDAVAGLGVTCNDCHVAEDRSSDAKEMKVMARMMFSMVQNINKSFPDGKVHVTCFTCHRGVKEPVSAPPAAPK